MNSINTTHQFTHTRWNAANKLRGNINSSDYKYVVLELIFIKHVSDTFETQFVKYKAEGFDESDEDFFRDYLTKDNIFYVPSAAVLQTFNAAVEPLFVEIGFLTRENQTLAATRDKLLRKLFVK